MKFKTISSNSHRSAIAASAGIITFIVGLLILAGWEFHIDILKSFGVSSLAMKPNPALAFVLAGVSVVLLNTINLNKFASVLSKISAAVVFWIGLLTIVEYLFHLNFHIDQILFNDVPGALLTVFPGRMSFNLALGLTSTGIALLFIGKFNQIARGLAVLAAIIGILAVLSYLLNLSVLLEIVGVNTIALNSAISLIILSAAIYFTVPEREFERSKLENQSLIAFIAIALVLVSSNILFLILQNKVFEFDKQVSDINIVINKIENALSLIEDIESDTRGYVISGDDVSLALFNKSESALNSLIIDLKNANIDYPANIYLDSLRILLTNKLAADNECISIRNLKGLKSAIACVSDIKNIILMNYIREIAAKSKFLENESCIKYHNQEMAVNKEENGFQAVFMFVLFGLLIVIYINISHDISDRTKAEVSLKESEEKFRSISQSASDAIISADSKGIIIGWNNGAENIFGYNQDEIIGENLVKIVPLVLRDKHVNGINQIALGGEPHIIGKTLELNGLHKNGYVIPIELSLSEWKSSSSKYYSAIIRDITRRKRIDLEQQILYEITEGVTSTSNLDEFLTLMHSSLSKRLYADNCFVALYNPGTGLFSFPYFVDKFDQTPAPAALLKSCTAFVFRSKKSLILTNEMFDRLIDSKEVELIGSPSPSWLGVPLQTPNGIIGVLVIQHYEEENIYHINDIEFLESIGTQVAVAIERKLADEEIKLQNQKLSKLNAEKDKLFSIIAHDLRSPFSGLMNLTEIMGNQSESFSVHEYMELSKSLHDSAGNLYKLINNLFEWAQLQKGSILFSPSLLNLHYIVSKAIESSSLHAQKKFIKITNNVPETICVYADEHMLNSVIRNLISNAVKFTEINGNVTIIADNALIGSVQISVTDSGIGMSDVLIKKLFTIGEKIGSEGTAGELSTGLGLLICKEFVDKHNGSICVNSELGIGSTFTITIPNI